jgi:RNA polymerase sigma factor (TIGR02999 family)
VVDPNAELAEIYTELRAVAGRMLRREAPTLTLQPTELVAEAALRIVRLERMSWNDRQHFFATGTRIMRQAMLDAVRSRRRAKRQAPAVFLETEMAGNIEIEALDAALTQLEKEAPDLARIVEMRFFVGLPIDQIALLLDTSESTVKRRWQTARLWLASELQID